MENIANFLKSVVDNVLDILDYLNPTSENFILKGVLEFLGNILSYLNPFHENFILKGVLEFLGNILSYINPFSDNFLGKKIIELLQNVLEFLFKPSDNNFNELSEKVNEKFAFIDQIKVLLNSLLGFNNYGDKPPTFEITYENNTVSIIDFSMFLEYRIWLHGIILAISWFMFARRLYAKLPGVIGGFGG